MINNVDKDGLKAFGKHLAKTRKSKKLSQRKLAIKSDLEISQISRIERGLINPTLNTLLILSRSLEIELTELVDF